MKTEYDRAGLSEAIKASGVGKGSTLFCHSNVGFFGRPDCEMTPAGLGQMVINAVLDVIGDEGTFVVPTFSYSFAKGEDFEPAKTPSVCGMLTDYVMRHPDAVRSHHPDFSVAAIGARAKELTNDVPANAFGPDSFFERFERLNGKICNFNFDAGSTFAHYVERTLNVPYRYDKKFFGNIIVDGVSTPSHSINFVHDLNEPMLVAAFEPFHARAVETSVATVVPVGRGNVCTLSASDVRKVIEDAIVDEPFFLTRAHNANERPNLSPDHLHILTDTQKTVSQPAVGVTIDTDLTFEFLAHCLPVINYTIPTGTTIGATIIPEKWERVSATVKSVDGSLIATNRDIKIAAHSVSFSGEISGADLLNHVVVSDSGQCLVNGGWKIVSESLLPSIDPHKKYQVDLSVRNTFGALRYAILPGQNLVDTEPEYVSLSQDPSALETTIEKLGNEPTPKRSTLFYVAPFKPDDIHTYHLQTLRTSF